jgi:hypothetical protein
MQGRKIGGGLVHAENGGTGSVQMKNGGGGDRSLQKKNRGGPVKKNIITAGIFFSVFAEGGGAMAPAGPPPPGPSLYERLDIYCTDCGRIGHKQPSCLARPEARNPSRYLISLKLNAFSVMPETSSTGKH